MAITAVFLTCLTLKITDDGCVCYIDIEGSRLAIVCPCLFNIVIIRYSPNQIRLKTRLCTNQSDQKFGRF